jgi:hypothetical protein
MASQRFKESARSAEPKCSGSEQLFRNTNVRLGDPLFLADLLDNIKLGITLGLVDLLDLFIVE